MKYNNFNIDGFNILEYEKANIYLIKNLLDNDFCNNVINIIQTVPLKNIKHFKGNNVECGIANIDDLINMSDNHYYSFSTNIDKFKKLMYNANNSLPITSNLLNGITNNEINNCKNDIDKYIIKIKKIMKNINEKIVFDYNSGYSLRKITGSTRLHNDGINTIHESDEITFIKNNNKGNFKAIRNSTLIFSLNDNYDGGIFNFPYYDISFKLEKGDILIFPPYWTHSHQVSSMEKGTLRYTITTWTCEKIF